MLTVVLRVAAGTIGKPHLGLNLAHLSLLKGWIGLPQENWSRSFSVCFLLMQQPFSQMNQALSIVSYGKTLHLLYPASRLHHEEDHILEIL